MSRGWKNLVALAVSGVLVNGCDSGPLTAGIDRSGSSVVSRGPITGFGSIIVNDVHYELSGAQIDFNGNPATETDLAVGQIVTVSGSIQSGNTQGTANTVVFEANVQGPVDSVDVIAGTLVVMGQTLTTDANTVFDLGADPAILDSINAEDLVQVSGFAGAGGLINASLVKREAVLPELRVIGIVSNLDLPSTRFEINGLVVDYGGAQMINGFPSGQPANGDEVVVEGSMLGGGGELPADELALRVQGIGGDTGEEAEVEGLITRFVSPTDFDVAGIPIMTTPATVYEGGSEANLILNVKIEVEGTLDASGVIVADKIEVKDGGQVVGG